MAGMMEVLGESLEASEAWTTIAPYMKSMEYTSKYLVTVLNKQEGECHFEGGGVENFMMDVLRWMF